jgi:hypothetical protein
MKVTGLYKVGDICIGVGFVAPHAAFNGMECEIIAPLANRTGTSLIDGSPCQNWAYTVRWADGRELHVIEKRLRLKRPPEEKSSWEEIERICGFHPEKIEEKV